MPPAGASETDGQVTFSLALIERNQIIEQASDLVDKTLSLRLRHHVFAHARVVAGERPQLGDKKGFGMKRTSSTTSIPTGSPYL